jgi:hypothetical protein
VVDALPDVSVVMKILGHFETLDLRIAVLGLEWWASRRLGLWMKVFAASKSHTESMLADTVHIVVVDYSEGDSVRMGAEGCHTQFELVMELHEPAALYTAEA